MSLVLYIFLTSLGVPDMTFVKRPTVRFVSLSRSGAKSARSGWAKIDFLLLLIKLELWSINFCDLLTMSLLALRASLNALNVALNGLNVHLCRCSLNDLNGENLTERLGLKWGVTLVELKLC